MGELELIRRFRKRAPKHPWLRVGPGQDCAILEWPRNRDQAFKIDQVIEGTHFKLKGREAATPKQVGWKAMAKACSDIAAAGCWPVAATVAVNLQRGSDEKIALGIYDGIVACCRHFKFALAGGDISTSRNKLSIVVSLLGDGPKGKSWQRKGARPGDVLIVTGTLGGSRAGKHLDFTPRLSESRRIRELIPDGVRACIDITDGLSRDLAHLCEESDCGAIIEEDALPCSTGRRPVRSMALWAMRQLPDDDDEEVTIRRGAYLPHWTKSGSIYAVTFRLQDSLPAAILQRWRDERDEIFKRAKQPNRELSKAEQKKVDDLFSLRVNKYLDSGSGSCVLAQYEAAKIVRDALLFFNGTRYDLFAWCVMPNHVHIVVRPRPGHTLSGIIHSWKSYTAQLINKALNLSGALWQPEYFDRMIRDEEHLWQAVEYVLNNPELAKLKSWELVSNRQLAADSMVKVFGATHGPEARATLDQALGDGEDFELLLAVKPAAAKLLLAKWDMNTPLAVIGEVISKSKGIRLRDKTGTQRPMPNLGYEHKV